MNNNQIIKISKKLSYLLRHKPEVANIELDEQGWTSVSELIEKFSKTYFRLTREALEEVVAKNNKKRFAFNDDNTKIRASQGHSIEIDLNYEAVEPPEFLYHGTAEQFIGNIKKEGLQKRKRHHVHLSTDEETAHNVGSRHGKVVILKVKSKEMHEAGHDFFQSENGVWLTDSIPVEFLIF